MFERRLGKYPPIERTPSAVGKLVPGPKVREGQEGEGSLRPRKTGATANAINKKLKRKRFAQKDIELRVFLKISPPLKVKEKTNASVKRRVK